MANRKNRQIETRLRQEYLQAHFQSSQIFFNQRLGTPTTVVTDIPPDLPRAALANRLAYADAMVVLDTEVQLWEAKISAYSGLAVGELLVYAHKYLFTPELQKYSARHLTLHILCTEIDPDVALVASANAITVHIYRPEWAVAEIASAFPGRTRPIDHLSASVHA